MMINHTTGITLLICILFVGTVAAGSNELYLRSTVISHDINSSSNSYTYYTYGKMTNFLHDLQQNHTGIMNLTSIGTTYQGRNIWMVKISDNVTNEEDEPGVLLMGAHHGNEKTSYEILIYFIQNVVELYDNNSDDRISNCVNTTQIYVIPMVNPDGVEANTRKNCAPNYGPFGYSRTITSYGVNLNRNYGYGWFLLYLLPRHYLGGTQLIDSGFNYRGEKPFCENETLAIKNFIETHSINISLSYHCYGEIIFYPWIFTSIPTSDEKTFISLGENISKINNYELRGYQQYRPVFAGSLGSSEDWLYAKHHIFSFLIELGTSRAPTDPTIVLKLCQTHMGVNLYVCEHSTSIHS